MPLKGAAHEQNNNIGPTTIATTAATNGTAHSDQDEVNRNIKRGKTINHQMSTLVKGSNENALQFQHERVPSNHLPSSVSHRKSGSKEMKSSTFYKQQIYQEILKASDE